MLTPFRYMVLLTYSQADRLYADLNTVQFTFGLVTPAGNLLRALLLTLNQSQLVCRTQEYVSYPGEITVYGGPILYLVLQIFVFYSILVCYDNGWFSRLSIMSLISRRGSAQEDSEKTVARLDPAALEEVRRVETSSDALRVLHLTKQFGSNVAVEDVTFGNPHDNILALLGPNGAGKSTTIDMIRGKARPSQSESSVLIENIAILKSRIQASRLLGVCPQFDTMDRMTVTEHLSFYARTRGVPNISHNVSRVISAVGLSAFKDRMAGKLSGGNQRKLSLGTAIIGNPSVLLLDEPSSGMDAVAKRVMWKVIKGINRGRSIVLTTHSMEEASALANRAAILARRLLAIGEIKDLARRHGDGVYHVHLYLKDGDSLSEERVRKLRHWIAETFPDARISGALLHGQIKFVVPIQAIRTETTPTSNHSTVASIEADDTISPTPPTSSSSTPSQASAVSPQATTTPTQRNHFSSTTPPSLPLSQQTTHAPPRAQSVNGVISILHHLEANKEEMGIGYYSVAESTLEDVFLKIVGQERGGWEDD
jgi:ATP-binding cassette, subfamily A (ABC1), member 3